MWWTRPAHVVQCDGSSMAHRTRATQTALTTLAATTLAALATAGCSGSSASAPSPHTQLRVVNAAPDAPPLDVTVYGSRIVTGLPYDTPTSYIPIGSGAATITVNVTGDSSGGFTSKGAFVAGRSYSLLAIGRLASLTTLVTADSTTPAPTDSARIRVIDVSPSAPTLDVYVMPVGGIRPATPTFTGVGFGQVSSYTVVAAAPVEVVMTVAGSTTVAADDTLSALPGGAVRTVLALDHAGGGTPILTKNLADHG